MRLKDLEKAREIFLVSLQFSFISLNVICRKKLLAYKKTAFPFGRAGSFTRHFLIVCDFT